MLTGKCKEDFEKWCDNNVWSVKPKQDDVCFYEIPFSMQYGVYVDFFDANFIDVVVDEFSITSVMPKHDRTEARTKAIEKANDIYNNQNQIK